MFSGLMRTVMISVLAYFLFKNRGRLINALLGNEKIREMAVRAFMNMPGVKKAI